MNIRQILASSPVMPVLVIEDLSQAIPLAQALCDGGIRVLEVALRTTCAMEAIRLISRTIPEALVGAGTVLQPEQFFQVQETGARFAVSPGFDSHLCNTAKALQFPYLPGVFTPSECMAAAKLGFDTLKLYPAREAGACNMLRALAGPLPDLQFCPSGGVDGISASDYLQLDNVICVSGSWLTPSSLLSKQDWQAIQNNARLAAQLNQQ